MRRIASVHSQSFVRMQSDDEDVILAYHYIRSRRKRRLYWTHPYIERNINCRLFIAARELLEDDSVFHSFYRMSKTTYQNLLQIVGPLLQKQNTNMRDCVSPDERILITLR